MVNILRKEGYSSYKHFKKLGRKKSVYYSLKGECIGLRNYSEYLKKGISFNEERGGPEIIRLIIGDKVRVRS